MGGLALLLLLGLGFAQVVEADIVEEKDTGAEAAPALVAALWLDCESGNATLTLSSNGSRVEGATVFLFRADSAYKLLARSSTDEEGVSTVRPQGKTPYLNDLYILRIEKSGFRTKEIEFTFWNCGDVVREFSEYSLPEEQPEHSAAFANETAPAPINGLPAPQENAVAEVSGPFPEPAPGPGVAEPAPSSTCIALPAMLLAAFGYVNKPKYTKKYLCILQSKSPKS
ncbi:MAG: hypothetical protein AB1529_07530 [Candidatus Micrarchaeota archaeon]